MESGLHSDPAEGHLERAPDPQATLAGLLHPRFPAGPVSAWHLCNYLALYHVLTENARTSSTHHVPAGTDDSCLLPGLRDRPAGVHESAWPAGFIPLSSASGGGVAAVPADAVLCRPAGGGSRGARRNGLGEDTARRRASRAWPRHTTGGVR